MNDKFALALDKAKTPGSVVLANWMATKSPTAIRNNLERGDGPVTGRQLLEAFGGVPTGAGVSVNETSAMRVSTVYACVGLIAGAVSTLPLHIYQRGKNAPERIEHPYWWMFNEEPNQDVSAAVFWEYLVSSYLLYGDAFARIVRPSKNAQRAIGLKFIHPLDVRVVKAESGELYYEVSSIDEAPYTLNVADILHVPCLGFDGKRGMSPIRFAARQAVGISLAADEYSARFFGNSARPDFALETDSKLTQEQIEQLRASWMARFSGGANSHMPAVLSGGLKIKPLQMDFTDAQLLESRKFEIEEICRVYGVPPHMVGHTEKSSSWGTGVENMGRGFAKFTLARHLAKFEQELNRKLWPTDEKTFVEFNVAGLERGDLKSENEALRIALGRAGEPGWMTTNEVRRIKNMPPIDGGDAINTGQSNAQTQTA